MTVDDPSNRRPYRTRPWRRAIGILLMLPIGLIAALALIFLFGGKGSFGGWWWVIIIVIFLVLFTVRISFRRSRRRYWMQQHQGQNGPMRILEKRYARGEITKEQFDQMSQGLQKCRYRK
ncbi:MAG: SHOCT domain-containing protein [Methanomassiliicoccales archaeon]